MTTTIRKDHVSASSTVVFALTDRLMLAIWECLTQQAQREIYADCVLLSLSIRSKRRVCPIVPNETMLNVFCQNFFEPTGGLIEAGIDRNILFSCYEALAASDEAHHESMIGSFFFAKPGIPHRPNYADLATARVLIGFIQRLKDFLVDRYKGLCYKLTFQSANRSTRLDADDLYQNRRSAVLESWGKFNLSRGAFATFVQRNITTERVYDTAITDNTIALSANHRRMQGEINPRSYAHEDLVTLVEEENEQKEETNELVEDKINVMRKIFAQLIHVHPELKTLLVANLMKPLWLP